MTVFFHLRLTPRSMVFPPTEFNLFSPTQRPLVWFPRVRTECSPESRARPFGCAHPRRRFGSSDTRDGTPGTLSPYHTQPHSNPTVPHQSRGQGVRIEGSQKWSNSGTLRLLTYGRRYHTRNTETPECLRDPPKSSVDHGLTLWFQIQSLRKGFRISTVFVTVSGDFILPISYPSEFSINTVLFFI